MDMTTPPKPRSQPETPDAPEPSTPLIHTPLPNYTLSTVCPACNAPTVRRACKVRCDRCGFMWDCSEL
ncbi:MAG: transposase [Chloroflexi bacterium]|nr:transposase [Chloroflexota bacterium]